MQVRSHSAAIGYDDVARRRTQPVLEAVTTHRARFLRHFPTYDAKSVAFYPSWDSCELSSGASLPDHPRHRESSVRPYVEACEVTIEPLREEIATHHERKQPRAIPIA